MLTFTLRNITPEQMKAIDTEILERRILTGEMEDCCTTDFEIWYFLIEEGNAGLFCEFLDKIGVDIK